MRGDLLTLALIVGACTWAFRFLPTRADLSDLAPDSLLARFLSATGPAAIATLFVASVTPELSRPLAAQGPMLAGVLAVCGTYWASRSVVGATLAGSFAYGLIFALI